jgi:hypothetical protein
MKLKMDKKVTSERTIKKRETTKAWDEKNKNRKSEYQKQWYAKNKEKIREKQKLYENKRLKIDVLFKLKKRLNSNINKSLKRNGYIKDSRTYEILGCSYENFKQHIESLWQPWMNWDNYGLYNGTEEYGWDIDHIIPSSSANTEDDIIKLNHHTNLQPLCSFINRDIKKALF